MNEFGHQMHNVLIVDDVPIVRQGLSQLINRENDLKVCGEAADVREARTALQHTKPNVVVLDLSLRASDDIYLVKDIRSNYGQLPILVFSMHDEDIYAERVLSAGANGYIMKRATTDQLLMAIRQVLAGGLYVSERIGTSILERSVAGGRKQTGDLIERLSDRELEVFTLFGRGRSTRQVADSLNLSVKTVDSHRQRIKKKLGLQTATQLDQFAISRLLIGAQR